MAKVIIGLLVVLGTVAVKVMTWYWSPEAKAKRDSKDRAAGHQANASKDGRKLGSWLRKRWRR